MPRLPVLLIVTRLVGSVAVVSDVQNVNSLFGESEVLSCPLILDLATSPVVATTSKLRSTCP